MQQSMYLVETTGVDVGVCLSLRRRHTDILSGVAKSDIFTQLVQIYDAFLASFDSRSLYVNLIFFPVVFHLISFS